MYRKVKRPSLRKIALDGMVDPTLGTVFYRFANNAAILSDISSVILSERSFIYVMKLVCLLSSFMTVHSAIFVALSDIPSDIL